MILIDAFLAHVSLEGALRYSQRISQDNLIKGWDTLQGDVI